MPFFILFFIIPLIEIAVFILIGDEIGIFMTLALCFVTAVIGGLLVKYQGLQTFLKAQNAMRQAQMPLTEIFDGFCIVAAGALLLTPGFVTDALGFSLLIPPVREVLRKFLANFLKIKPAGSHKNPPPSGNRGDIIDGVYERLDQNDETL